MLIKVSKKNKFVTTKNLFVNTKQMLWLAVFTYVLCILVLCVWMFSGSSNHGYGFDSNYSELSGAAAAREAASIYDVKNGDEIKASCKDIVDIFLNVGAFLFVSNIGISAAEVITEINIKG